MARRRATVGPVAFGYVRTSPDEGSDPDLSMSTQAEAVETYARLRELNLVETFQDEGIPGSMPLEARAGGSAMLDRIVRPDVREASLLVYRLDRLFSSSGECLSYQEAWKNRGIVMHVIDLAGSAIDTGSPAGQFMISVLQAARDMEEVTRERGKTGRHMPRAKRKEGEKPLLGEKVVRGYIVEDRDEMLAVRRIKQLASEGKSLRLIAEALDQEGIPTKRRAKAWSKEAIRLILRRIENGEVRDLRPTGYTKRIEREKVRSLRAGDSQDEASKAQD